MRVLPILFNADMVRAILDGRKTVTRRVIKPQPKMRLCYGFAGSDSGKWRYPDKNAWNFWGEEYKRPDSFAEKNSEMVWTPPCHTDDVLYVRETWCNANKEGVEPEYYYYADIFMCEDYDRTEWKWRPSIYMPKEAARIWLKVTDVQVKHLQEITIEDVWAEGLSSMAVHAGDMEIGLQEWKILWDSTIKKSDYDRYGWNANPWVWVIEFERCEKPIKI